MNDTDKQEKRFEYEVVLNTGGGAVMSSRVDAKTAGRVAMAFGMDWPSECVIRWPLLIRKVGVRPEIEGQALSNALRQIVEIPDGEIVIWIAGKKGALGTQVYDPGDGMHPIPQTLSDRMVLEEVRKVLDRCGPDWGWIVKAAESGEVLAK